MVAALRSLLAATALLAVFATTAAAQDPACDRTWNGTSGNWNDASRWSGGAAPGSGERGCLPAGAYTVTVTGGTSPKGVTVGAGATVVIKEFQYIDARAASFINHGTVRLEQNATLYGPLTNDGTVEDTGTIPPGNNRPNVIGSVTNTGTIRANQGLNLQRDGGAVESTGRLETADANALLNGWGYPDGTWTLAGTIVNPGTMQFQAGTMRVRAITAQSGNPFRTYQSKLDLTGATGTVETIQTVDLVTDIPAAATVRVTGRSDDANLRLDADHTNNGTLVFDSTDVNRGTALSNISAAARLTNAGTLRVTGVTGADRNVRIPITNTATGTMTVDAGTRMVFQNDAGETITAGTWNINGNVWVQGGATTPSRITQTGGAITVAGGVSLFFTGGRYTHQGGTTSGELQFQNNSTIDPSGPGAATYHVVGYVTLAGNVNAAGTINLEAGGGQPANLTMAAPYTLAGRMTFTTGGANAQETEINGGQRLTVTGRIDVLRGQGGTRHFKVPLTLAATGQFNVEALSTALLDGTDTYAHQIAGTVTVAGGGYFGVRSGTQTVTQTGGTINGAGAFSIENLNAFVHQGGTVPGELALQNGSSLDPSGPGAATYHVVGVTKLTGDVNAAATINADASLPGSGTAQLTLTAPRTVAGRVNLTSSGSTALDSAINGLDGALYRLTVTGRLDAQKGAGGIRTFTVPLTIAAGGQFNVEADARVYVTGDGRVLDHQLAGSVTVGTNGLLLFRVATQTITQTAGTISATGTFNVEGNAFVHQGGTVAGLLTVSSSNVRGQLDPSGPGTVAYQIVNAVNLTGDVHADARIDVGAASGSGTLYVRDRDVTNRGAVQVGPNASIWPSALSDEGQPFTLTNAGTLTTGKGGGRTLDVRLVNTGTIAINENTSGISSIADKPLVTNSGTITIDHAGFTTWRGYTQTGGLTDLIDGSLGSPRTPADIQIQGGRLRGAGILYGPVTNGATIEVGRAGVYGKLQIKDVIDQIVRVAASYAQTPTGRLAVDIGGTVAGTSFDQLTVDGPATLDGALDVTTAAGYTPTPNTDTYRPLLSETRSGAFANLTGGRFYTLSHDATGAVLTGRVPPPPSGELTISDAHVLEGAGALTFTVTLSQASTDAVTVDWTTEDDTATAGADYTASSGTLTFPAGTTTRTLTVPVVNDAVVEGTKQLLLRLRHPVNATLEVATGIGRIDPDDVGITNSAPTSVGVAGNATIVVTGGGFGAGTTVKLTRAGQSDRAGTITSGPENGSKFAVRFDMRGAAQGQWLLVVTTPTGTANTPITVQSGASALYASLSMAASLRYGWVGRAILSVRNAGANDVSLDGVRFSGTDLELRPVGGTGFTPRVTIADTQLGDAQVIPALSTRTVEVEVRSTTTVGHAFMKLDAEVLPTGYKPVAGSDPDPGSGSIAGKVTSAAGTPVRGLRVTAFDGTHSASTTTDGSGAYTLKPLKPGSYKVTAADASGVAAVDENARTVDLVTGVADLAGTVGKGDATVALLRDGKAVSTVAADATGGFRFRVARPGAYTLVADSPTGGRASRAVTVVAGADQPGVTLTFGTRTLTVTTAAGATVRVWPAGEQDLPSTRTATGTTVMFTGLPAGALSVEARATGKAPATTTTSGATATAVPGTAATLGGLVTQGGTPVESAFVVATSPATGVRGVAVTGANGRYSVGRLAAGTYDVWVMAPGAAPLVKRGVATGATNADAAVVTTGGTLDVKVGSAVGRLVEVVDPATGVTIAASGTVGPDAVAHFGPLPNGTYEVRGAGAGTRTVTVGAAPKAARAAAEETVTLDDEGYPVVADPQPDPAYEEYTSPFSGLKAPQLNEKDRLGWDQVQADYPGPCPTADRLIDTIRLKQRAKLVAFSAWVDAWDAVDTQNRADIEKLMTISAQFAANSFLALATLGEAPPGMSYATAGALGNLTNYIGTFAQGQMGLLDPISAVDHAQYFKDVVDVLANFQTEYGGAGPELNYLSSVINVVRGLIDISDQARAFPEEVAARAGGYLEAQSRYDQIIREINDLLNAYREAKQHCPELIDRGPKPPVVSGGQIENITSNDPNEIWGPAGVGAQKWIARSQALGYSIRFENLGPGSVIPPGQQPASAPATVVKVVTTLSPSVNVDAVTLGGVGWGAVELAVPAGLTTYHKDVPQAGGDIVRVDGALNKAARTITWTLKTIDPATGEVDGSPTAGFLPPEDGTRRGQGHVDYVAGTPASAAQGAAISAKATITFDVNTPIETGTHTNTVDGSEPAATLTLGTPSCDGKIPVSWTGTDTGSGIASYDIQVAKVGGGWTPWLAGTAATSATFAGTPGTSYAFRVMARDAVGNQETAPDTADATIALAACDLTPPRTTASLPGGAVGGWYGGPVDVKLSAVDAPGGSGVATLRYAGKQVAAATATERVSAEGVTDLVFSAVDAKGNAEADGHLPVRIDTTAPAISGTDGATYVVGQVVVPDVECTDAGSGVVDCAAPATLDTAAAGAHAFTARSLDRLGHVGERRFTFTVVAAGEQPSPPGGGGGVVNPPPAAGPSFGAKPVTVKLGKVTRTSAVITLTGKEAFAFTGKATLLTTAKKPKPQSKVASFSLAKGKSTTVTLKLKPALRKGKKVKLVLRLELASGAAKKVVDVKVTLRAR